jgi:hypothetical protein
MKKLTRILALILPLAIPAGAGPLQRQEVAAEAKWLLHLDLDKLRSTPEGASLIGEVADRVLAEPKAVLKREVDFDLDFTKASSITAYGDYSSNSVLLVKTDLDVEKLVDAALVQMAKYKNLTSTNQSAMGCLRTLSRIKSAFGSVPTSSFSSAKRARLLRERTKCSPDERRILLPAARFPTFRRGKKDSSSSEPPRDSTLPEISQPRPAQTV